MCGVLWSFENDFGNETLEKYVRIVVYYAVDELCLTLDGVGFLLDLECGDYVKCEVCVLVCVLIECVGVLWCEL